MPKPNDDETPNRLLSSEALVISNDPLVGILILETDDGPIDIAMNRGVAEQLREQVNMFLSGNTN